MQMYVACLGSQVRVVDDGYDFFFFLICLSPWGVQIKVLQNQHNISMEPWCSTMHTI